MQDRDPTSEAEDHRLDLADNFVCLDDPQAWRNVRLGLGMYYWGSIAAAVMVAHGVVLVMCLPWRFLGNGSAFSVAGLVLLGVLAATIFLALIGFCLSCAAPPASGARGQAQGAAICLCLCVSGGAIWVLLSWLDWQSDLLAEALSLPGSEIVIAMGELLLLGLCLGGHWLFMLFLRNLARYFHDPNLVTDIGAYLSLYLLFFISSVMVAGVCLVTASPLNAAPFVLMLATILLILWVLHLRLIGLARDMISERLRKAGF